MFKTTCNVWAYNNFEFTFQLMTVCLLNTEGFQNLKYCIRSKGFLEHLEELLHPTVLEISAIGVYNTLTVSDSKLADRNRVGQ